MCFVCGREGGEKGGAYDKDAQAEGSKQYDLTMRYGVS